MKSTYSNSNINQLPKEELVDMVRILEQQKKDLEQQKKGLEQQQKELQQENSFLNEQLKLKLAREFGRKSEKSPNQADLFFDEAEEPIQEPAPSSITEEATTEVPAHTRKKATRKPLPDYLPRETIVYELTQAEQVCPNDGTMLKEMGEEITEQLDIIPATAKVIRHVRKKYACPCCNTGVHTAPMPKQPIAKSNASPGLLAYIAVNKYQDALPLYRQESILTRSGVDLPRSTLSNWMLKMGELVIPLTNQLQEHLLTAPLIHMDETRVQVVQGTSKKDLERAKHTDPPDKDKEGANNHYMWVQRGGDPAKPIVMFHYHPSRAGQVVHGLLPDYQGILMADGYSAYQTRDAQQQLPNYTLLGCWAHARRKFVEADKLSKNKKGGKAQYAIKRIAKLYKIEKDCANLKPAERMAYRQQHAQPILHDLEIWKNQRLQDVLPKQALGKAIAYLDNQWNKLTEYLNHPWGCIDNNPAENAIRPFVIGRKNWLFSYSANGAHTSARLYSLIETAKANGLEPIAYLKHLFTHLPNAENVDDVEKLLPWLVKLDSV